MILDSYEFFWVINEQDIFLG